MVHTKKLELPKHTKKRKCIQYMHVNYLIIKSQVVKVRGKLIAHTFIIKAQNSEIIYSLRCNLA